MKKLSYFIFFAFLTNFGFTQDFGKMGSSWNYTHNSAGWELNIHIETIKDTVVHGKTIHKLLQTNNSYTTSYYYVHQSNDTVYQYYPYSDTSLSLYIFNVNQGDTITLESSCFGTPYRMVIDTVFTIIIDGISLRKFSSRGIDGCSYAPNAIHDTIIEGIGSMSTMFPSGFFAISSVTYPLRCYSDSIIDTNFTNLPCDYHRVYSIYKNSLSSKIKLSPNPAKDLLNIKTEDLEIIDLTVLDLQGKEINITLNNDNKIDISGFESGLYILKVVTKSGIVTKKWVKE